MNTLTPRTDKAVQESNGQWSFAMRNLCIEMECEIAALTKELAEAKFDLQFRRDLYALQSKELAKTRELLIRCLSIMPVGHVPTHTAENLPEMIGDLAKALAEETTEREQLERELAEARSMTAGQWLLKVATRLVTAGCKSDGIVDAMDELIQQRDTLAEALRQVRAICLDKSIETHPDEHAKGTIDDCIDIAESALAVKGGKA